MVCEVLGGWQLASDNIFYPGAPGPPTLKKFSELSSRPYSMSNRTISYELSRACVRRELQLQPHVHGHVIILCVESVVRDMARSSAFTT